MTKHEDTDPDFVDFAFLLRLQGHLISSVMDSVFMGRTVDHLRRRMKKDGRRGIVYRAHKEGVAHVIANRVVDAWFYDVIENGYPNEQQGSYDVFWLLRTMRDVWFTMALNSKAVNILEKKVWETLRRADDISDIDAWCDLALNEASPLLIEFVSACRASRDYRYIKRGYSAALADRILHDRQLCAYLANQMLRLAPVDRKEGGRKKLVERVKCPSYVSRIVVARDRGRWAYCQKDIAMELLAVPHIDHIFSIRNGGCNDIINLQLCCETCNLKKGRNRRDVEPSVPSYLGQRYTVAGDEW